MFRITLRSAPRSGPPAQLPLRVFTECVRSAAPTFPSAALFWSAACPSHRIAPRASPPGHLVRALDHRLRVSLRAVRRGRAMGLSSLLLLRLRHRRKSLLLRAVGRRFKSRGLTRRCSGLATLAAELHFVRPTIEKLRHNVVTQRLPFFMIANRKRYRGIHAGLLPPPCQGSADIWQGSRVARCDRTRTTHWLAQPPSLAR